jgi:hypothetical protein
MRIRRVPNGTVVPAVGLAVFRVVRVKILAFGLA